MANIVYRETDVPQTRSASSVKNSELTYEELDSNFKLLDQEIQDFKSSTDTNFSNVVVKQIVSSTYTTNEDLAGIIPLDNTKPQITEGVQLLTLAITPKQSSTKIWLEFEGTVCATSDGTVALALFNGTDVDAIYTVAANVTAAKLQMLKLKVSVPSTNTTARTYSLRVGTNSANTIRFNGNLTSGLFNGTMSSVLTATEIK